MASNSTTPTRLMTGPRTYHVCRSVILEICHLCTCVTQDDHVAKVTVTHHESRITRNATRLPFTEIVFFCNFVIFIFVICIFIFL